MSFRDISSARDGERGFAILTVVAIMVIFGFASTASVSLLTGSSESVRDEYSSQEALSLAEAGVQYMAKQLTDDADWAGNSGTSKNLGDGSFEITYVGNPTTNSATIKSTGTVGSTSAAVSQSFSRTNSGGAKAFDAGIYTEGNVALSGQGHVTVNGAVLAGGNVTASGQGHIDIGGDLGLGGSVQTSGQAHVDVTGDTDDSYSGIEVPTPNWGYWQGRASNIISGNVNLSGQGSTTYDGITYITGNLSISGQRNLTVNGTLVVLGTMSMSGQGNLVITPTAPNPAIVAQGNVSLSGQASANLLISGWIITMGSATLTGQGEVNMNGGLVAEDGVTLSGQGAVNITYAEVSADGFDGGEQMPGGSITFGTWQEVY